MSNRKHNKELKAQLWGWGLFVVCGFLFTLSGLRARDMVSTLASILFLLGCVVFIIPLVQALLHEEE